MFRSLRAKLGLTYAGLTLLIVGALALYSAGSLEELLLRRLADDLMVQARLVGDLVSEDIEAGFDDAVRDRVARVDAITAARVLVVDAQRRVVAASEQDDRDLLGVTRDDVGFREAIRGEENSLVQPRTPSGEVLYVATPIRTEGRIVGAVRLAYRLEDLETTVRNLNIRVAVGALFAVGLAVVISFGFARAIGNPVQELSHAARSLAAGNLNQKLTASSNDEIGELVESFNGMATKLREAEIARRELASDVSHELQSLASSMQVAAEALERGAGQNELLRERLVGGLVGHTRRLNRLAEDLLQLARSRRSTERDVCSLLDRERGARYGRRIRWRGSPAPAFTDLETTVPMPLLADQTRLTQAVGNLVENAIKYTAPGGEVKVLASRQDGEYLVTVSDNGQGISSRRAAADLGAVLPSRREGLRWTRGNRPRTGDRERDHPGTWRPDRGAKRAGARNGLHRSSACEYNRLTRPIIHALLRLT